MFFLLNLTVPMFLLFSSLMFIFSSSSWFIAWMGLELNMMAFMPMIINSNKLSAEAALKYFFAQVVGSALVFLFMMLSFFYSNNLYFNNMITPFTWMIVGALMLKLGAAPFHFWFPSMIEGLTWNSTLLLMTLQKAGPLSLISLMSTFSVMLMVLFIIISALVGSISGYNQTMSRKLMSFSSITHVSWLLCSTLITKSLMIMYFILYTFMSFIIIFMFKMSNTIHLSQMFYYQNMMLIFVLIFYLNLLSLGGLPPFLGFLPKWLIISSGVNNLVFPLIIMVFTSVVTLYFYLRLTYSAMMMIMFQPTSVPLQSKITTIFKLFVSFPMLSLPMIIMFL